MTNDWAGDRIAIVGRNENYKKTDKILKELLGVEKVPNGDSLYKTVSEFKVNQTIDEENYAEYYAYNHDKKEYLSVTKQFVTQFFEDDESGGKSLFMNTVSALVAFLTLDDLSKTESGYPSTAPNFDAIGDWAGDHISASRKFDERYSDYTERTELFWKYEPLFPAFTKFEQLTDDQIADLAFEVLVRTVSYNYSPDDPDAMLMIEMFKPQEELYNKKNPYYPFIKKYVANHIVNDEIVSIDLDTFYNAVATELKNKG